MDTNTPLKGAKVVLIIAFSLLGAAICAQPLERAFSQTGAPAQSFEIRLVNGKTGLPMTGKESHVNLWVGTDWKDAVVIGTETDGIAKVELTRDPSRSNTPSADREGLPAVARPVLQYGDTLAINVPYASCSAYGTRYSWLAKRLLLTQDVLQHGYVSPNTCGKAMTDARPGQIVLYVRPLTFWEELKE